ncbi:MAG: adenylate/guanylate cyclase domain-containing protein [Kiloniellales bacterium]
MSDVERKLTTILAADVVGYSKLMGEDETGTVAALKACRSIIDSVIAEYHGRIFGSAGDSVLAEFQSPVQAVWCATEFQKLIAERNAHHSSAKPMEFRVGINIGDVIIEGDNLYGDGVNVTARLQGEAKPGGICVSAKVHEEVKRKMDVSFVSAGKQTLKNIEEPVEIFHIRPSVDAKASNEKVGVDEGPATLTVERHRPYRNPTIVVLPATFTGGDEVQDFAEGLIDDILVGLARHSAITALSLESHASSSGQESVKDAQQADYALKANIRASGKRIRVSLTLIDNDDQSQTWSERYDRTLDDVFELQDEISQNVVTRVRVLVKAKAFERLRNADDSTLSVPELLDKAGGYLVRSYRNNREIEASLRVAIEKEPENSMAKACLAYCLYREWEFNAHEMPAETIEQIRELANAGIALDPSSYFARLVAAFVRQDIDGDFNSALAQAESSASLNPNYTQAQAMIAIAKIYLGETSEGLEVLQKNIEANKEDPHRYRHRRELAIGHFLDGKSDEAAKIAARLVEEAPELKRNKLLLAGFLADSGQLESARTHIQRLLEELPGLSVETIRMPRFGNEDLANRFRQGLIAAGLPEISSVVSLDSSRNSA